METVNFRPYEGGEPFVFISYAHRDSQTVLAGLRLLRRMDYRLWYDEGIDPGSEWPENIARHLTLADTALLFVSPRFAASQNCLHEARFAASRGKRLAVVYLEDAELPGDVLEALRDAPSVRAGTDAQVLAEALAAPEVLLETLKGEYLPPAVPPPPGIGRFLAALGGFLLLAGALAWFGGRAGWFDRGALPELQPSLSLAYSTPEPASTPAPVNPNAPVEFTSQFLRYAALSALGRGEIMEVDLEQYAAIPRAVRQQLGLVVGETSDAQQLLFLTELHLCGNAACDAPEQIGYRKGVFLADGMPVVRGSINTLKPFISMQGLTRLSLVWQRIDSSGLEPVKNLTQLQYLDLSGNEITTLAPLTGLSALEELNLSHTSVTNLALLYWLPSLRRVVISRDMVGVEYDRTQAPFDIVITE